MAVHQFKPDHYYAALGTYPPVLQVADGDSVITSTVDASGCDLEGSQVTSGPNPQTGPFYVEGAEPGDTLRVCLDKLWPNRRSGFSSTRISPNVVDPSYVAKLPTERQRGEWELDLDAGTTTLIKPVTKLGRLTLPIQPMLGCFGVAPPMNQAISTSTSSTHGGNMDYKRFEQGAIVHFPVFVEGALFFVGDGHAVQGDGEIAGTGIETSFDVQFTVSVLKGKQISWPRLENDTHIITIGNARPLDQALQHATTEMIIWLQEDYDLEPLAVHTLLGQCVEYEIGNVFDPAYTMACKLSKKILSQVEGKIQDG